MKNMDRKKFLNSLGLLSTAAVVTPAMLAANTAPVVDTVSPIVPLNRKVKVGVIGCGSVSTKYLPHLSKSPFVEIVSVCDKIPERAQNAAKKNNVANWYPHIDQMMAGVPFDLLVNLTDMQEHGRLNKIALNAGKNVWSEKPMANTYEEGVALLNLAEKKGIRIWGAPAVVNSPQFAFMAQQLAEKKLGRVASAHACYGHEGPTWSAFFYEKNGGSIPDLGVYNLATLTGLLGPAKSVVAMTNVITPERNVDDKGTVKVEAEDNSHILLEHETGALSHIMCGFNYYNPHGHDGKDNYPTVRIIGHAGAMDMIGYDWHPLGVELGLMGKDNKEMFCTDKKDYVWEQGASVISEALSTGKEPLITVKHTLHVLEIMEGVKKSQETGKRIALKSKFKWPVIG